MKRWDVRVRCDAPHLDETVPDIESDTRELAAVLARASQWWPAGSTFCPRLATAQSYRGPGCWLDSAAGELFTERGALA